MDVSILTNLNKNFNQEWENLNFSQQKEVIDYLKESANEAITFINEVNNKLTQNYNKIYKNLSNDIKSSITQKFSLTSIFNDIIINSREETNQKLTTTKDEQFVFTEMKKTLNTLIPEETQILENLLVWSNDFLKFRNNKEDDIITENMTHLINLVKRSNFTSTMLENQIKKLEELFPEHLN